MLQYVLRYLQQTSTTTKLEVDLQSVSFVGVRVVLPNVATLSNLLVFLHLQQGSGVVVDKIEGCSKAD
eukprot:183091-Amphidinium_carterae.1